MRLLDFFGGFPDQAACIDPFPDAENKIFIHVSFGIVDSDVFSRFPTLHDDVGSPVLPVPDVGFDEEIDRDDGSRFLFADSP